MGLEVPKQFCPLAGLPILVHTLRAFQNITAIKMVILAVPPELRNETEALIDQYRLTRISEELRVVSGGRTRQESVKNGLDAVPAAADLVLVHDGARPLVTPELIEACLQAAHADGAAMAAIPANDTLKAVSAEHRVISTVNRDHLWQAQTPQAARTTLLQKAYAAAARDDFSGTDEASLLEHIGCPVTVVAGSGTNIKITRPEDLVVAEAILRQQKGAAAHAGAAMTFRAGHGYDAHCLVRQRPLVLGGVVVPHSAGLSGHSDADVLTHALCDAILGAIGAGDIGMHFPDTEPRFRNIRSIHLLEQVVTMAREKGFSLANADLTIIAQRPKLAPYLPEMRGNLAATCRVDVGRVNIKATTTEKMGFAGREEGIAAHAVVLMSIVTSGQ